MTGQADQLLRAQGHLGRCVSPLGQPGLFLGQVAPAARWRSFGCLGLQDSWNSSSLVNMGNSSLLPSVMPSGSLSAQPQGLRTLWDLSGPTGHTGWLSRGVPPGLGSVLFCREPSRWNLWLLFSSLRSNRMRPNRMTTLGLGTPAPPLQASGSLCPTTSPSLLLLLGGPPLASI